MTEKCGHHKNKWKKKLRRAAACFLIFCFIVLLIILLVWAILQPKKPRFVLQDATVFNFNLSAPYLSSNIQVTVTSRNPNDKIGIYYDKLDVYAVYRDQQITYYTAIPPVYQGHKASNVWSPFIYGTNVPVAPVNGLALSQDQTNGGIWLLVKIDGRLRWKVGSIITGRYRLHVTCLAYVPIGNRNSGNYVGNAVKYQLSTRCGVSI